MRQKLNKYLAEFIGTFALVFSGLMGIGVSSQFAPSLSILIVPIVFGLVISVMIYAVGHISGAHFNPAVTFGFWVSGRFPKREIVGYWAFQILGAILGAWLAKSLLLPKSTLGLTLPTIAYGQAIILEVILTFFLMFVIISVATDHRAKGMMAGIAIGGTVALAAFIGGALTGASMNPARSFGPAFVFMQWQAHWIYWLAPLIGSSLAVIVYEWIRCDEANSKQNEHKDAKGCC